MLILHHNTEGKIIKRKTTGHKAATTLRAEINSLPCVCFLKCTTLCFTHYNITLVLSANMYAMESMVLDRLLIYSK